MVLIPGDMPKRHLYIPFIIPRVFMPIQSFSKRTRILYHHLHASYQIRSSGKGPKSRLTWGVLQNVSYSKKNNIIYRLVTPLLLTKTTMNDMSRHRTEVELLVQVTLYGVSRPGTKRTKKTSLRRPKTSWRVLNAVTHA